MKWIYKERNPLGKLNIAKKWHQRRSQAYYQNLAREDILQPRSIVRDDVVVSLTMKPGREDAAILTIKSLLHQDLRPSEIILWLAKEEFEITKLPKAFFQLQKLGLTVRYVGRNLKSYNKIVPTLRAYPDKKIVTADDDILYPPWWLSLLLSEGDANPDSIVGYRCFEMIKDNYGSISSYSGWPFTENRNSELQHFATGVSGIYYPASVFEQTVLDEEIISEICPHADDIWLKVQAILCKKRVRQVFDYSQHFPIVSATQENALQKINKSKNDDQLSGLMKYYHLSTEDFFSK
ncbi:MAG: hypothetical protein ACO2ZZ_13085 [Cyclobacteriaceae bacterium]